MSYFFLKKAMNIRRHVHKTPKLLVHVDISIAMYCKVVIHNSGVERNALAFT